MNNLNYILGAEDNLHISLLSIDMAGGDIHAGLILDRLRFWLRPGKNGKYKTRVHREDRRWVAKGRSEWYEECRLTPRQVDNAVGRLKKLGLIEVRLWLWNGAPTLHFTLNEEACNKRYAGILGAAATESEGDQDAETASPAPLSGGPISPNGDAISPNGENRNSPNGENNYRSNPGRTTSKSHCAAAGAAGAASGVSDQQAMFRALVGVTGIDPRTREKELGRAASTLRRAGRAPADVIQFGDIYPARVRREGWSQPPPRPSPSIIVKYIAWIDETEENRETPLEGFWATDPYEQLSDEYLAARSERLRLKRAEIFGPKQAQRARA